MYVCLWVRWQTEMFAQGAILTRTAFGKKSDKNVKRKLWKSSFKVCQKMWSKDERIN